MDTETGRIRPLDNEKPKKNEIVFTIGEEVIIKGHKFQVYGFTIEPPTIFISFQSTKVTLDNPEKKIRTLKAELNNHKTVESHNDTMEKLKKLIDERLEHD